MKKIKFGSVLNYLICGFLLGCADQKSENLKYTDSHGTHIVGGQELKYSDALASSIVYISTENSRGMNEICTGTFISENLILTAAHCIAKDQDGMSLSFRSSSFSTDQEFISIPIQETYKLNFSDLRVKRNDMGVIQFKGGLPRGASIALLPKKFEIELSNYDFLMLPKNINFFAVGYGRNTGSQDEDKKFGEGILRVKQINSPPVLTSQDSFIIDQYLNKGGVCYGDSGGPALIIDPVTKKSKVIGVASAVLTKRRDPRINPKDDCQNQSIYLNMYFYAEHFNKYLKLAVEAKAKENLALAEKKKNKMKQ